MKKLILFLALIPSIAWAQPSCGLRDSIVQHLEKTYNETLVLQALNGAGLLMEIFASPEGTWTELRTQPNGRSCAVDSGEGWYLIPERPKGDPA